MSFHDLSLARLRDLSELTAAVAAAYQVGVFRELAREPGDADALARRLELRERGLKILLPVLEELELVESAGETYALTPRGRRTLGDPDAEEFVGGGLPHWLENLRAFTRLPEVLSGGGPVDTDDPDEEEEREHLARFMAAMAAAPEERVERIVRMCLERRPGADTVLDLGGGPGHMARAFVREGCRVTLFDRPGTVELVAEEYGLREVPRLTLLGGDFMDDPLPEGPFDVVLMSNVVHIYSPEENRRLLARVAEVVSPGGCVAVGDFLRGRSPRAERFALVMLLRTEGGNTYREEELVEWLDEAGFERPVTAEVDDDRQLLTAIRRASG